MGQFGGRRAPCEGAFVQQRQRPLLLLPHDTGNTFAFHPILHEYRYNLAASSLSTGTCRITANLASIRKPRRP